MKIQRNQNQAGRVWNMVFGLACVVDGLIRLVSLGFLHTTLCLDVARKQAKIAGQKAKAARKTKGLA